VEVGEGGGRSNGRERGRPKVDGVCGRDDDGEKFVEVGEEGRVLLAESEVESVKRPRSRR